MVVDEEIEWRIIWDCDYRCGYSFVCPKCGKFDRCSFYREEEKVAVCDNCGSEFPADPPPDI